MIDSFLKKVFAFSRIVAALVVFLCVLTMVGGAVYYAWSGPEEVDVPDFEKTVEAQEQEKQSASDNKSEAEELAEQRKIEKKYGDDLEELVNDYGFDKDFYDNRIGQLLEMDEELRGAYVKGLKKYLKKGKAYIEEKGENAGIEMRDLPFAYDLEFAGAVAEAELSKVSSKAKRMTTLGVIGGALYLMIMFLFIPLLIQIEINTRSVPQPVAAAPAPAPAPASSQST